MPCSSEFSSVVDGTTGSEVKIARVGAPLVKLEMM